MSQIEWFSEIGQTLFVRHKIYVPMKGVPDVIMKLIKTCKEVWEERRHFKVWKQLMES